MDIFDLAKARKMFGGEGGGVVSIIESTTPSKSLTLNDFVRVGALRFPNAESIGDYAFQDCASLTSIDLPAATSIGNNAFYGCTALTSIDLPSAARVNDGAFSDCINLEKADLHSATSIGNGAFRGCTNLQAIILRTTETVCVIDPTAIALDADENGNPTQLANYYVPASMYEYYRAAYEPAFEEYGFAGYFDVVFHKIEDLPEI